MDSSSSSATATALFKAIITFNQWLLTSPTPRTSVPKDIVLGALRMRCIIVKVVVVFVCVSESYKKTLRHSFREPQGF